jgi:hypothetical protein
MGTGEAPCDLANPPGKDCQSGRLYGSKRPLAVLFQHMSRMNCEITNLSRSHAF